MTRSRFDGEALERRKAERIAGRLNKPIRGRRGLAATLPSSIAGHELTCECRACLPDDVRQWWEQHRDANRLPPASARTQQRRRLFADGVA